MQRRRFFLSQYTQTECCSSGCLLCYTLLHNNKQTIKSCFNKDGIALDWLCYCWLAFVLLVVSRHVLRVFKTTLARRVQVQLYFPEKYFLVFSCVGAAKAAESE